MNKLTGLNWIKTGINIWFSRCEHSILKTKRFVFRSSHIRAYQESWISFNPTGSIRAREPGIEEGEPGTDFAGSTVWGNRAKVYWTERRECRTESKDIWIGIPDKQ